MTGKSLELFFVDGEPDGLLTAEVFNWTGHVLSTPRTQLAKALKRPEASNTGVYILLGELDGEEQTYIGEGENIADRIKSHDSKKEWWTRAVLITTTGNVLNKAHVQYLESKLIEKAKSAKRTKLENSANPRLPSVNEAAESNMEAFLDQLYTILPAIRIDVFAEQVRPTVATIAPTDGAIFELQLKKEKIMATAILSGSEFIVQKDSLARMQWIGDPKHKATYYRLFNELVEKGILAPSGNVRVFTENYAFSSPSAAGAVVNGRNTSGPISWSVRGTGETYKEWEASRLDDVGEENTLGEAAS